MLLLLVCSTPAQQNAIDWSFSSQKIYGNLYQIKLTATLEKGWHIYSREPGDGPLPTSVTFISSPVLALKGGIKEAGKIRSAKSDIFNSDIKYYENKLTITQNVWVKFKLKTSIKGRVEFMICNNEQCLPPKTIEFLIELM
jgi:thiol:disulfide interchange protein DsbD